MSEAIIDLSRIMTAIDRSRSAVPAGRSVLVGLSGIDGSGKGFLAASLGMELEGRGLRLASLSVDAWLNLPSIRFSATRPAEHFYAHALRLDQMFADLVLPLRRHRSCRLSALVTEETATEYREHYYDFHDIDVVLLEGIFVFKRAYRDRFDLALWIDCTFETALERALQRSQEALRPAETRAAYETIYFPAQRFHLERDQPHISADLVIQNDPRLRRPDCGC